MHDRRHPSWIASALAWVLCLITTGTVSAQALAPVPGPLEVLTRGPLHEAFAEPFGYDPIPGAVINQESPAPLDELPPQFSPPGDEVLWIGGYWAWDDEAGDFVWVSGIWRTPPPGCRWVPGYWAKVEDGHQWVSGFWIVRDLTQRVYLPEPPRAQPETPAKRPPAENQFYNPGTWVWADGGYRWQPGDWRAIREERVWVPARYVWTPHGFIARPGYWDYEFHRRGVPYAPVRFPRGIEGQPRVYYTPQVALNPTILLVHLFARPQTQQYYFGDYYDPAEQRRGIYGLYHAEVRRGHGDAVVSYLHRRRQGVDLAAGVKRWHDHFAKHPDQRPPRTYAQYRELARRHGDAPWTRRALVVRQLAPRGDRKPERSFQPVPAEQRRRIATERAEQQDLQTRRRRRESTPQRIVGPLDLKPVARPTQSAASRPADLGRRRVVLKPEAAEPRQRDPPRQASNLTIRSPVRLPQGQRDGSSRARSTTIGPNYPQRTAGRSTSLQAADRNWRWHPSSPAADPPRGGPARSTSIPGVRFRPAPQRPTTSRVEQSEVDSRSRRLERSTETVTRRRSSEPRGWPQPGRELAERNRGAKMSSAPPTGFERPKYRGPQSPKVRTATVSRDVSPTARRPASSAAAEPVRGSKPRPVGKRATGRDFGRLPGDPPSS